MTKRRRSSSRRPARTGAMPSPTALAEQLVESYAGIAREPDPMQLEMVASSLCAPALVHWIEARDEPDGQGVPGLAMPIVELLANVRSAPLGTDALALVMTLGALDSGDRTTAEAAERVAHKLRFLGARPSTAAAHAGRASATRAALQRDVWGDQASLYIEYAYEDLDQSEPHSLVVLIDSNLAALKDAYLAPPLDELLANVRERFEESPEDSAVMTIDEIDLVSAAAILAEAVAWSEDQLWEYPDDPDARELAPLVTVRSAALVAQVAERGGSQHVQPPTWHQRPSELDALSPDELVEYLLASEEFEAERELGANEPSASMVAAFAVEWMEGGRARFGPQAPEMLMLHFTPDEITSDEHAEQLTDGLPATIRAWIRLTHRILGLPDAARDLVLRELTTVSGVAPDGSRVGGGFASRLAAEMDAAGVDFSDPAQVDAFMHAFNERSHEERGRILGLD